MTLSAEELTAVGPMARNGGAVALQFGIEQAEMMVMDAGGTELTQGKESCRSE